MYAAESAAGGSATRHDVVSALAYPSANPLFAHEVNDAPASDAPHATSTARSAAAAV